MGKREASEAGYVIDESDARDVKPDLKPGLPVATVAAFVIRPATTSAASSPDAQRHPLPSFRARMCSIAVRPAPPPVVPNGALKAILN